MKRREFLKGLLATATVAVVPAFPVFAATDRERLQNMLDAGIPVVGQYFAIRGRDPIVLRKGSVLRDSTFEFVDGADTCAILVPRNAQAHIIGCSFYGGYMPVCIQFEHDNIVPTNCYFETG